MLVSRSFSEGCTLFDVVLQCYFSINLLPQLIMDNNVQNVNAVTTAGQVFLYDPELVTDEFLRDDAMRNDYKFCTGTLRETDPPQQREIFLLVDKDPLLADSRETILLDEADNKFIV